MASLLKQRTEALFQAFGSVETNAQAVVFATRAAKHAELAREDLAGYPFDMAAQTAIRTLGDHIRDVVRYAQPMAGADPNAPVSAPSWEELRKAIGRLYSSLWAIEDVLTPDARDTFATMIAHITTEAVRAVPKVIKEGADWAADVLGAAAGGAAKLATKPLWEIIKGIWPVLLAAGVIVGAGVYLAVSTDAGRAAIKARIPG